MAGLQFALEMDERCDGDDDGDCDANDDLEDEVILLERPSVCAANEQDARAARELAYAETACRP